MLNCLVPSMFCGMVVCASALRNFGRRTISTMVVLIVLYCIRIQVCWCYLTEFLLLRDDVLAIYWHLMSWTVSQMRIEFIAQLLQFRFLGITICTFIKNPLQLKQNRFCLINLNVTIKTRQLHKILHAAFSHYHQVNHSFKYKNKKSIFSPL